MTHEEPFEHGHADRLTVVNINYNGSKLLTASIDHKVTVYNIDQATGQRHVLEKFTAHDADIRDAKWLHVNTGTQFASIANDLQLRIWAEDPYQQPCSGRRFRRIATIPSGPRVPFVSLDTKTGADGVTYIAVIDRHGLLSVYEPTQPDEYNDWTLVDQFNVVLPQPSRGEETSFKVQFDPNPTPLPYVNYLSDDNEQLGLVVTAGSEAKIYRSTSNPELLSHEQRNGSGSNSGNGGGASHRLMFFEAAKLTLPSSSPRSGNTSTNNGPLIRDVAWAASNVCGADKIAIGGRDGRICIYEVTVATSPAHPNPRAIRVLPISETSATSQAQSQLPTNQQQQSTLTSALSATTGNTTATLNSQNSSSTGTSNNTNSAAASAVYATSLARSITYPFPYLHRTSLLAVINDAHQTADHTNNEPPGPTANTAPSMEHPSASWSSGGIWNLTFDPSGQLLMSGGADGTSRIWRRSVLGTIHARDREENDTKGESGQSSAKQSRGKEEWLLFAESAVSGLGLNSDEEDDESGEEGHDVEDQHGGGGSDLSDGEEDRKRTRSG